MNTPIATADVAIAGCGIIGLATAERLVAAGLTVILVDESGVAGGPSGASGGLVRAFMPTGGGRRWALEGFDAYLRRGPNGAWPAIRPHGGLTLFGADETESMATGVKEVEAAGHPAHLLCADEIHSRFPGLSVPADFAGVYEPDAGWLPARDVAAAMLRDAGPGATLLSVRATAVATSGGAVTGLHTTQGFVRARAVLVAAGVGSSELARTAGVRLPLRSRAISYCVFAPRTAEPGPPPTVVDTTTGAWLRPWATGDAVLAGVASTEMDVPSEVLPTIAVPEQHRVRSVVRHRYSPLADADVVGGVTAYDAVSPDGSGAVTAWPEPVGLVTATGWNGGGFKIAPAVGAQAATLLREVIA
jgi:glycine/D-amino acid oxidase-like deaminating enzyme